MFTRIYAILFGPKSVSYVPGSTPSDAEIIDAVAPWTCACSVGAHNSTFGSAFNFDTWFAASKINWLPDVMCKTKATEREVHDALVRYVQLNAHKHYRDVLMEESKRRES